MLISVDSDDNYEKQRNNGGLVGVGGTSASKVTERFDESS